MIISNECITTILYRCSVKDNTRGFYPFNLGSIPSNDTNKGQ